VRGYRAARRPPSAAARRSVPQPCPPAHTTGAGRPTAPLSPADQHAPRR
jgi:hypothetical protein